MTSNTSLTPSLDRVLTSLDTPITALVFKTELAFGLLFTAMRDDERTELGKIQKRLPQTAATCDLSEEDAFRPLLGAIADGLARQRRILTENEPLLYTPRNGESESGLSILAAIAQRANIACRVENQAEVRLLNPSDQAMSELQRIDAQPDATSRITFMISDTDRPQAIAVLNKLSAGNVIYRWPALVVLEPPNLLRLRDQLSLD